MQAAVLRSFDGSIAIEDLQLLPIREKDVCVQIKASGVCHSDLSASRGQYPFPLPLVLGHEGSGVVIETGPQVTGLSVGDRVVGSWVPQCGRCFQCLQGRSHLCEGLAGRSSIPRFALGPTDVMAMSGLGTMAELMVVHESCLVKIETDLDHQELALIGCAATTGIGAALWTAKVEPGSSVAIFGCGGVGLCTVLGAGIAGAGQIIAVDPIPFKRQQALRHGATHVVDPTVADATEQVRAHTSGRGADYTFEVVGRLDTMRQAFDSACSGGVVTYVGAMGDDAILPLPANALRAQGKQIRGSQYGSAQVRRDMPRLVRLAESGRLVLNELITKQFPLVEAEAALTEIESGRVVRSVLVPGAS